MTFTQGMEMVPSKARSAAGGHSGNSPRVQLTLKRLKNLEANEVVAFDEDAPITTKKAAQKLTNFRAYLHKSSVAGCFVDLLEVADDEGLMTESGPFPVGLYNKSHNMHNMRRGGFRPSAGFRTPGSRTPGCRTPGSRTQGSRTPGPRTPGSRTPGGRSRGLRIPPPAPTKSAITEAAIATTDPMTGPDGASRSAVPCGGGGGLPRRRRRPSTALAIHTPSMLARAPELPLTSRVSVSVMTRFSADARGVAARSARAPRTATGVRTGGGGETAGGGGGGWGGGGGGGVAVATARDVTTLEVHRTQWVEVDGGRGGGGGVDDGGGGGGGEGGGGGGVGVGVQSPTELIVVGREACDSGSANNKAGGNAQRSGDPEATRPNTAVAPKPRAKLAWGEVAVGPSIPVLKETRIKTSERMAKASKSRAEIIEKEQRRAEELLTKNSDRKRAALEAATLLACQQGLLEATMMVVAVNRMRAAGLKLLAQRKEDRRRGGAALMIQRAFKAYTNRRIFKVLLSIRRAHLHLHIGIRIRRKYLATEKIRWFLTTGNGGAKARPRMVIRAFVYHVRRCQRAAREWLACRAASIEALCRLWDRIESGIRRELGDELDRAKRVWVKHAIRSGKDNHIHGQWRELKAKTRSLVARIDRLETMLDKQRKRDKAQRVLAARSMLRRRSIPGSDGASRGGKKLAQLDSAEDLRGSTVPSAKRLAIIRNTLKAKFALHFRGAGRDEGAGNRFIGEKDARMLIRGELPDVPITVGEEGSVRSAKRPRAPIYTGDLGRSWQQIVEDAVMQDFQRNAFARKDSMPYLEHSAMLSLDTLAARGNVEGPSAAIAAAAAAAATAAAAGVGGSGGLGMVLGGKRHDGAFSNGSASSLLEERRRRETRQTRGMLEDGPALVTRVVLEPIL